MDNSDIKETTLPEDVAALFGACGFEIRSTDPAEKHPLAVCGSLDAAGLLVEAVLTDLASDAAADILDMLGQVDPFGTEQQAGWFERLCAARSADQPLPVPKGAVVIWRVDLVLAMVELLQLRAYRDHHRAKAARKQAALQQLVDQTQELGGYELAGATDSEGGHHD